MQQTLLWSNYLFHTLGRGVQLVYSRSLVVDYQNLESKTLDDWQKRELANWHKTPGDQAVLKKVITMKQ